MKIEVYGREDVLVREMTCDGADIEMNDGFLGIASSGLCHGCDGEPNEEKIRCYQKGKRIWFVDPANLAINNDWKLTDFMIVDIEVSEVRT